MTTQLFENTYDGYAYSYPHKHSYRRMAPLPLHDLWAQERKDALFLYIHLPFCEMRCGFCNLFTIANPAGNMVDTYLDALEREAATIKAEIAPEAFGQMAVGGGTPTLLDVRQLERFFGIVRSLGCEPRSVPVSFEMSPATISPEKLAFLVEQGIDRASIGIQSFAERELKSLGRPQKNTEAHAALDLLMQYPFETVNIDLIYGTEGQSLASWLHSVREAVSYGVREIFLYPLYVRPLTGMAKMERGGTDARVPLYLAARELLLEEGYSQVSMRLFRKPGLAGKMPARSYTCQEDGMVGIGAGARSYTTSVHYSSEYAVGRQHIRSIIEQYIARTDFSYTDYGVALSREEQQRRYIIKSVLHGTGLHLGRYHSLFNHDALRQYTLLQQLLDEGLAARHSDIITLTPGGMGYSDAIGPALYSEPVRKLISEFELQ